MEDLQGGTLALEHHYDVEERVGTVAFTTLYRGSQQPFEKPVWVEVYDVLAEAGAGTELIERVKRTALESNRLEHPGVLRTIDFGDIVEGVPFVIAERVEGSTLASHLESEGTLPPGEVGALVDRLATVIKPAHDHGMNHGSLSPAWIHLPAGRVDEAMVGHFRLGLTLNEMRSAEGAILSYEAVFPLPPEMFGDDPEPDFSIEGDVYAVAAIAYTALVGVHPYFEDVSDTSEGLLRIVGEEPRHLTEFGVDESVADVIHRGLEREPGARWADLRAFADALNRAIAPPEPTPAQEEEVSEPADDQVSQPSPEVEESAPPEEFAPGSEVAPAPSPSGSLLAIAILLLVVSNVGWYLYTTSLQPEKGAETAEEGPVATNILPSGIELMSEPPEATVLSVTDGEEQELGVTPLVLGSRIPESEPLTLSVRKDGYESLRLDLSKTEDGQDLTVHLTDAPE